MENKKELTRDEVMQKLFYGVKDIEIILDCSHSKAQQLKNEIGKIMADEGKCLFNRKVPKRYFIRYLNDRYGF